MGVETVSVAGKRGVGHPPAHLRALIGAELDARKPSPVARDALVLIAETVLRTDPRLDPDQVTGKAGLHAAIREAVAEVETRHPTLFEAGAPRPEAPRPGSPPVIEGRAVEQPREAAGASSRREPHRRTGGPVPPRGPELAGRRGIRPSHLLYGGLAAALLLGVGLSLAPDASEPQTARSVGRIPEDRRAALPPPSPRPAEPRRTPAPDPETTGSLPRSESVVFPEQRDALKGVPDVVDTATLKLNGKTVRLFGVQAPKGARGEDLARYLKRRPVECEPTADADAYRCAVERYDLSEVVLYNGGGRAAPDASPDLKAAEAHARENGLGVWKGR